jgi:hypothetical protein
MMKRLLARMDEMNIDRKADKEVADKNERRQKRSPPTKKT